MARPVSNPPNPWERYSVDWLGEPPTAELRVLEEDARSVLARNESPDVPFRWSVNPYRGCYHACAYCYARPSHQLLGYGAGTDFDRTLVVKRNAPAALAHELARGRTGGDWIAFSGNTDCYQPLEASYELTRGCLEACLRHRVPVSVLTKGTLVRRDLDLLAALHERAGATLWLSIPFADEERGRRLEPGASSVEQRFETLRLASERGIPTGVSVSPLIPGLNESDVPRILERAREAGATRAFQILLRLAAEVRGVFEERLRASFPDRADHVLSALADARGGELDEARFGARMRGRGPRWEAARRLFEVCTRRLGYATSTEAESLRSPLDALAERGARAPEHRPTIVQHGLFEQA